MAKAKITDLALMGGAIDPTSDLIVLHDNNLAVGQRTVAAPVQKILDLVTFTGSTSEKITLTGPYNLLLTDPDVIAFDPNFSDRTITLPTPSPTELKQYLVFSDDLNYALDILEPGTGNLLLTLGGMSSLTHFHAYSIQNDWYIIKGSNI